MTVEACSSRLTKYIWTNHSHSYFYSVNYCHVSYCHVSYRHVSYHIIQNVKVQIGIQLVESL